MTSTRVLIVDDEPLARRGLRQELARFPAAEVVGECANGLEAVQAVVECAPDLVLLDVQMPGLNGFDVIERIGADAMPAVIFVTAYDRHALRAFEVHALDYVLKPFGKPRFSAAVTRALERLSALDALTLQRTLASMADDRRAGTEAAGELALSETPKTTPPRRLGVRTGTKTLIVDVEAIDWVEALGDYARIHAGKATHLVAQRMHALERLLEAGDFIRIHRSLIVNLKRVRELHREADGSGFIVLHDGIRLRVARGRWELLQEALEMEEF